MLGFPQRKPDLIVHSTTPLNAEPPLDRLRRSFITDAADFYIRSHGDTPAIDAATHEISVEGLLETYADHGEAHLDQMQRTLAAAPAPKAG